MVAGCGADLFVNICLTLLGYIPGHIHAFYASLPFLFNLRRVEQEVTRGRMAWRPLRLPEICFPLSPLQVLTCLQIEYVYFDRRERARHGQLTGRNAPGVYSERVQGGGAPGYGTI
jgi:hypothetical protein